MTPGTETKIDHAMLLITLRNGAPIQIGVDPGYNLGYAMQTAKAFGFFCNGQIAIPWDWIGTILLMPPGSTVASISPEQMQQDDLDMPKGKPN